MKYYLIWERRNISPLFTVGLIIATTFFLIWNIMHVKLTCLETIVAIFSSFAVIVFLPIIITEFFSIILGFGFEKSKKVRKCKKKK